MQLSYLIILACSIFMGVNASASPAFTTAGCTSNGNSEVCTEDRDCCSGCCVDYVGRLEGVIYSYYTYNLHRYVSRLRVSESDWR